MGRIAVGITIVVALLAIALWVSRSGGGGSDAPTDIVATVHDRLNAAVDRPGVPADPWVLAHGLLALDPEDPAAAPIRARWLDDLDDRWVVRGEDGSVTVPLHTAPLTAPRTAGERGEQHPHLVFKVLVEVGGESVDLRALEIAEALARTAVARFRTPDDYEGWNDVAWFLHGLARLHSLPRPERWTADDPLGSRGTTGRELALGALAVVETADRVVEAALSAEGDFVRPDGNGPPETAGIYAYTCGGQHLLQAVVVACGAGWLPDGDRPRVAARIDTLIARLDAEERFRRDEEARARAAGVSGPRAARYRVFGTLKLHGHALETLALAHEALPGARPRIEAALATEIDRVLELLDLRERTIDPAGEIAPRWRTESPREWELWFGDGAHALHGLRLAEAVLAD